MSIKYLFLSGTFDSAVETDWIEPFQEKKKFGIAGGLNSSLWHNEPKSTAGGFCIFLILKGM